MDDEDYVDVSEDEFDAAVDDDGTDPDGKVEALVEDEMSLQDDASSSVIIDATEAKLSMLTTPKKTVDFLTKYEKTRLLGLRIKQLQLGAKPLVEIKNLRTEKEIAMKELSEKKLPFIIRRYISRNPNKYEDWKIKDLRLFA